MRVVSCVEVEVEVEEVEAGKEDTKKTLGSLGIRYTILRWMGMDRLRLALADLLVRLAD